METSFEESKRPAGDYDDFVDRHGDDEEEVERREAEEGGVGDEEFSFWSSFGELSLASADEAVAGGQVKPVVFPLFDRDLSFFDEEDLPMKPPVKKIFVQRKEGDDAVAGPYCDLSSRTVVEATPSTSSSSSEACKKSNSTGFSKIWRFRDLVSRSNSDGRDAFVFLNAPPRREPVERVKSSGVVDRSAEKVVKVNRGRRTTPYSAHEVYLRNKAKEGEKKRSSSYLPYRPELMGFFTSVNGGFSKNVHPY